MAIVDFNINLIVVLASAAVYTVIGFVWYSDILFGAQWRKLMKISVSDVAKAKKKGMAMGFTATFAGSLVTAFILAQFVRLAGVSSVVDGAMVGAVAWVGFIATVMLTSVVYENRPVRLYAINAGYHLVGFAAMGAILVLMA